MKIKGKVFTVLIISFLFCSSYTESVNTGTTGLQFLKIGIGARPIGIGGTYIGISDDINSIWWNPAGLGPMGQNEVTASYINWFQGVNIGCVGYGLPTETFGVFGIGINYLTFGNMPATEIDNYGNIIDKGAVFSAQDAALNLAYGIDIVNNTLYVGGNIKSVLQTIEQQSATAFMMDLGILLKSNFINIGFVIQNLGKGVRFEKDENELPTTLKLGASHKLFNNNLTLALDVNYPVWDNEINGHFGVEYLYNNLVAVRIGYKTTTIKDLNALSGLSFGFGIKYHRFGLDYAFSPYGDLGYTHYVSLDMKFGQQIQRMKNVETVEANSAKNETVNQNIVKRTNYVFGNVTNTQGIPLQNVVLKFYQTFEEIISVQTDADGTYKTEELPIGIYGIKCEAVDHESKTQDVIVIGKEPTRMDFVLNKTTGIATVLDTKVSTATTVLLS